MPFQNRVNTFLPPAVEGDFASSNPRAASLAGEGSFVAGPLGVTVGRFAWKNGKIVTNYGETSAAPTGFVHRDQQALIQNYLQQASNVIAPGFMVTLHNEGDFWVLNRGNASTFDGQQVYASYADGTAQFGAAPAGATATGSIGATFTATGSGTNLTTSAVTGYISPGDTIAGTGVPAGTTIISQTSGTTGSAGVYVTSAATTAAAATVTSFGSVINITAVGSGTLSPGAAISGTGVPAGANLGQPVTTAPNGIGQYYITVPATAYAASTAITAAGGVLTNFIARSIGAAGELVKISTWGKQ